MNGRLPRGPVQDAHPRICFHAGAADAGDRRAAGQVPAARREPGAAGRVRPNGAGPRTYSDWARCSFVVWRIHVHFHLAGLAPYVQGSNVRGLQTTATYIPEDDTFDIHTPTLEATKWWIGGLVRDGSWHFPAGMRDLRRRSIALVMAGTKRASSPRTPSFGRVLSSPARTTAFTPLWSRSGTDISS